MNTTTDNTKDTNMKRSKRIYLAGPMRGIAEFNFPAFDAGAEYLRANGFEVFSPAERDRETGFETDGLKGDDMELEAEGFSLREALGADVAYIAHEADAIVVLEGWEASSGARAECALACALGLPIYALRELEYAWACDRDLVTNYGVRDLFEIHSDRGVGDDTPPSYVWEPDERGGTTEGYEEPTPAEAGETLGEAFGDVANFIAGIGRGFERVVLERTDSAQADLDAHRPSSVFASPLVAPINIPAPDPLIPEAFAVRLAASIKPSILGGLIEERVTSDSGGSKGVKPLQLGAIDPLALAELGKVAAMGAVKYDRYNYLDGYPWSSSVDAAFRHLLAFIAGEDVDPESGLPHPVHFAWHGLCLTSFLLRGVGTDDRPPAP